MTSVAPVNPAEADAWAIEPSGPLRGDVHISGSKNAVTKLMVAALLAEGPSRIENAPRLGDVDITAGMLAVARTIPTRVPIQWYETSVEAMPLPDHTFDVVFCQLGLQFVADKAAALREMRRVLVPGGRIHVSVPTPTAFFNVLENALARHFPEAAPFIRLVFSLNDPAMLEGLFRTAGFDGVTIRSISKQLRLPGPLDFFWQYVQSTPLASAMLELDATVRTALEHDVVAGWQEWVKDGGLIYSQSVLLGSGRA